jgi:eukaryotic-like serine/threonine-protein kinase
LIENQMEERTAYLDRALDVPPAEREAWLRELETKEPQAAAEVRRLLAAHETARFVSFMNEPIVLPPMTYAVTGELIGNFRVLREIGQGGMAVVYLAERADGTYSQRVALKVLRYGLGDTQAQFHFAQERQILASLDHQSIARLLDAGTTVTGLHYLAMEYVEGVPIDRYCDEQRLSIDARLTLFIKVAEAVQYAHRHLIVHRDLKPSNIVVTAEGTVKLLDFGIAKLLAPGTFDHAAPPTRNGVWLMTPEYASPEQVRGDPVSTATDVYQLGLLLYHLLSGYAPYSVQRRTPLEAFRMICESEPIAPSATVHDEGVHTEGEAATYISTVRGTTPSRLRRMLRDDLDAIVLKALRKEPTQRYASVEQFIGDIRRHRNGFTVGAYNGVWSYRAGKFMRRHAQMLSVVAVAIVAVASVATWYTIQLADEKNRAQLEATTANHVAEFLANVFNGSSSRIAKGGTTARELLDLGAERIDKELANQPEMQARLLNVISGVYVQYDLFEQAQPLLERALTQNTRLYGRNSKETAETLYWMATLASHRDENAKSLDLYEEVLRIRESLLGPRHVSTADVLAAFSSAMLRSGEPPEAATLVAERALDIYSHAVDPNDERVLTTINVLIACAVNAGDLPRARTLYAQLLPRVERSLGRDHRNYAAALGNLAFVRIELGDFEGVEQQLRHSIQLYERLYGPDHGSIAAKWAVLGNLLHQIGRFSEALTTLQYAIDSQRRVSGPGDRVEAFALSIMSATLRSRGDLEGALQRAQEAMDILRKLLGPSHDEYAQALQAYGEIHLEIKDLAAALPALTEAVTVLRASQAPNQSKTATAHMAKGLLLMRTERFSEAETELRPAVTAYQKMFPSHHRLLLAARSALGEALLLQGKLDEAEPLLESSVQQFGDSVHYERRLALRRLIRLHELKGSAATARQFENQLRALETTARSR